MKINYSKWRVSSSGWFGFLFLTTSCFLLPTSCLFASDTGTSAGLLLRISPAAKTSAMAEAVTSLSENLASLDFNPASISNLPDYNFSFSHIEYFEDVNFEDMKFSTYIQKIRGNIGLTLKYLYSKDVERDERGIGRDEFLNSNTVVGISYARKIYPLDTGITVKYLSEKLAGESATVIAADLGLLYSGFKLPFEIGVSARNFGTKLSFGGDKDAMPSELRLGINRIFDETLLLSVDGIRQRENVFAGNLGVELHPVENFKLRTGYTTLKRYSFGAGFSAKIISIDYSFTTHEELSDIHRMTLSLKFGRVNEKPETVRESQKLQNLAIKEKPAKRKEKKEKITNIAVADFIGKNVSAADVSSVADFLRTELGRTGSYNVIEKATMDRILEEAAFQQTGCTTSECAVQIGKILNVQQMVIGTLSKLNETYYITVNLVDVETGKILKSERMVAGSSEELPDVCKDLARIIAR